MDLCNSRFPELPDFDGLLCLVVATVLVVCLLCCGLDYTVWVLDCG